MTPTTQDLITQYGNDAYVQATRFVGTATLLGDTEGADKFAESARELIQLGYHKYVKQPAKPASRPRGESTS